MIKVMEVLALGQVSCACRVIVAFPSVGSMPGLRDGKDERCGLKARVAKFTWL